MIYTLGSILLALLLADLLSGVLHFWEDRLGKESTPLIGRFIIKPNLEHHETPLSFTRRSFLSRNLIQLALVAPVVILLASLGLLSVFSGTLLVALGLSNEIHYYTHVRHKAPEWVKLLQDTGLIQSPAQHQKHHKAPQTTNYCVVTNLLNPALDRYGVWQKLEVLLKRT